MLLYYQALLKWTVLVILVLWTWQAAIIKYLSLNQHERRQHLHRPGVACLNLRELPLVYHAYQANSQGSWPLYYTEPMLYGVAVLCFKALGVYAAVFLDDVVVYSNSFGDHLQHVDSILCMFEKAGLQVSPSKCTWFTNKVDYLGQILSKGGRRPDDNKVTAVKNMRAPANKNELLSVLGGLGWGITGNISRTMPNYLHHYKTWPHLTRRGLKLHGHVITKQPTIC
jgi:Reverse transcriptase (RNA-dependent DNA polymerase)